MHEGKAYLKFEPAKGPLTAFMTLPITGCELAGSPTVKGTVFGEAQNGGGANKTGVALAEQPITFSEAIHKTTESTINVGGNTAILEGQAIATLALGGTFAIQKP